MIFLTALTIMACSTSAIRKSRPGVCGSWWPFMTTAPACGPNVNAGGSTSSLSVVDPMAPLGQGTHLLIIDPQVSFHPKDTTHAEGTLAVPGANEDSIRMANFIGKSFFIRKSGAGAGPSSTGSTIDAITVTLDTHSIEDKNGLPNIGFPEFFEGTDGSAFGGVLMEPGKAGNIAALSSTYTDKDAIVFPGDNKLYDHRTDGTEHIYHAANIITGVIGFVRAKRAEDKDWLRQYATICAKDRDCAGKNMMVWPHHCLAGTPGHSIHPVLLKALTDWEQRTGKLVRFEYKGMYRLTEMYSVFRPVADVPSVVDYRGADDKKYTETRRGTTALLLNDKDAASSIVKNAFVVDMREDGSRSAFNRNLYDELMRSARIVVGGEAMSHCVNTSVRHLVEKISQEGKSVSMVTVLEDTTSPVLSCEKNAESFVCAMKAKGVGFDKSTNYILFQDVQPARTRTTVCSDDDRDNDSDDDCDDDSDDGNDNDNADE